MSSAICFNLDQSKILLSGNGLPTYHARIIGWKKGYIGSLSLQGDPDKLSHYFLLSNPLQANFQQTSTAFFIIAWYTHELKFDNYIF